MVVMISIIVALLLVFIALVWDSRRENKKTLAETNKGSQYQARHPYCN